MGYTPKSSVQPTGAGMLVNLVAADAGIAIVSESQIGNFIFQSKEDALKVSKGYAK